MCWLWLVYLPRYFYTQISTLCISASSAVSAASASSASSSSFYWHTCTMQFVPDKYLILKLRKLSIWILRWHSMVNNFVASFSDDFGQRLASTFLPYTIVGLAHQHSKGLYFHCSRASRLWMCITDDAKCWLVEYDCENIHTEDRLEGGGFAFKLRSQTLLCD